ncbi:hypothetical protein K3G39_06780 [Pontibacter sp. HSC-14F20]|uniref:hypothetical protein n=1 Tax=Pontibacter sp. HSC-14F20 TaxID=2864136 RepID=UPI001C73713F|nr:hypothetical protein [Pontibacter sp. HSC-14F20]MBX0332937.1 hypothetical protein [Pontibacter sp. HSC-14F20]
MTLSFLPQLSGYDPVATSEGSIDPLGLYLISERLATTLVPGLRERMSHPRFLTAMAVGHVLCQEFDEQQVAADGQSPPWMVYEWLLVQALTKLNKGGAEVVGLPGSLKARRALELKQPLSATSYLKNPGTFGFHGVYRTLATEIQLLGRHQLGECGHKLVQVWEKEQNLQGFLSSSSGPGAAFRTKYTTSIRRCLQSGTSENWGWEGLRELAECLHPNTIGREEATFVYGILSQDEKGYRSEILQFMAGDGAAILAMHRSERYFHEHLLAYASTPLAGHLEAILAYEHFARLLQNVWEEVLYLLSQTKTKLAVTEMTSCRAVQDAVALLHTAWVNATKKLAAVKLHLAFENQFAFFSHPLSGEELIEKLIAHHQVIQKAKPPFGKRPWIEDWSKGYYSVRPAYTRKDPPSFSGAYVNAYRSFSLLSFLKDLDHVPSPVA